LAKVRVKAEVWLEFEDTTPISLGESGRVDKVRNISLGELGRCLATMMSTKDIKVRHLEALNLISEID